MNLTPYIDELRQHLARAAEAGGPESAAIAERLAGALEAATRLVLLDALSTAAGEITRELAPGSVDLRLRGREPEFVVSAAPQRQAATEPDARAATAPPAAAPAADEEGGTTRTTLRLPDHLKTRMEEAAAREGLSVNTWLVRAVAAALEPRPPAEAKRSSGGGESLTGWVR
jgi:hypothetical protein